MIKKILNESFVSFVLKSIKVIILFLRKTTKIFLGGRHYISNFNVNFFLIIIPLQVI